MVVSYDQLHDGRTNRFTDGSPRPYCPLSRMPCMGRDCTAARRRDLKKMETFITGHLAEWTCARFGGTTDFDSARRVGLPSVSQS